MCQHDLFMSKMRSNSKKMAINKSSRSKRSRTSETESSSLSEHSQGPFKTRHCTDVVCAIVFVLIVCSWIGLIIFAFANTGKLPSFKPVDSYGNTCGFGEYSNRSNLFFFNLMACGLELEKSMITGCSTPQVCVANCPNITFSVYDQLESTPSKDWLNYVICKHDVTPYLHNIKSLSKDSKCAAIYFKSEPMFGRCIPSVLNLDNDQVIDEIQNKSMKNEKNNTISSDSINETSKQLEPLFIGVIFGNIIEDIQSSWGWIFMLVLFGLLMSIVWVFNLHLFARYIIWSSFALVIIILFLFTCHCLSQYYTTNKVLEDSSKDALDNQSRSSLSMQPPSSMMKHVQFYFQDAVRHEIYSIFSSPKLWLWLTIITAIGLLILILILVGLMRNINLSIEMIEMASLALTTYKFSFLIPLIPYIAKLFITVFWIVIMAIIYNYGRLRYLTPDMKECSSQDKNCDLRQISTKLVFWIQVFNLYIYLWICEFIEGCYYMSLAGSFSIYYWTFNKRKLPSSAFCSSFKTTIRYHTGTVALGSFLIATFRFIQCVLQFIYKRVKKTVSEDEPNCCTVSPMFLSLCQCCLKILEKIISYISYNAFIMTAINGTAFCKSAWDGFTIIVSNPIRSLVLTGISKFLLFISKMSITFITGMVAFFLFQGSFPLIADFPKLHCVWSPVIVTVITVYIIANLYLDVYEVGVDTMFLNYLIDQQLNDGSKDKPYFMPVEVQKLCGDHCAGAIDIQQSSKSEHEKIALWQMWFREDK